MSSRGLALLGLGAGLIALVAAIGVASSDGPRLTLGRVDPWLVAFAVGLAVLLAVVPFAFHLKAAERVADRERRWEWALTAWGIVTLVLALLFVAIGLIAGFDPGGAGGSLAVVGCFECGLILAALVALVLGT